MADLTTFEGYVAGGDTAKAQIQVYVDLENIDLEILRRRYSQALAMLHAASQ